MTRTPHPLHGWGYEGRTVDDLIAFTANHQIQVVVDVRLNAISRRRGFSKRGLAEALTATGVTYLHRPALGNPRDNREGFATPDVLEGRQAHDRFRSDVLDTDGAREAVRELAVVLTRSPVALLCFEADQRHCHRKLVMEAVAALDGSILV